MSRTNLSSVVRNVVDLLSEQGQFCRVAVRFARDQQRFMAKVVLLLNTAK